MYTNKGKESGTITNFRIYMYFEFDFFNSIESVKIIGILSEKTVIRFCFYLFV